MRAVILAGRGGPEVLTLADRPDPVPAPGEVLVRVRAAGLNRADLLQRRGRYPAPADAPADIPGLEFAGEVAALGAGVTGWRLGDRVFGLAGGGAQAELLAVHQRALAPVPERLSWAEAAAVPEAFVTAWDALVDQAALLAGERVLVHAVASGVGLAAVQLARAVGATPFGTTRTERKLAAARALGLEDGIALPDGPAPLVDAVHRWTGGRGMHVVLDLVGGGYLPHSLAALAPRGRLLLVGLVAGRSATVDLGLVLARRLLVRGTVLRSRPLEEKILATRALAAHVVPLLARGIVRPVLDAVLPVAQIRAAHERLESNATVGKVVVEF
ncbi:MAG TPA: NAD(P)H-quinone oxidoreductase [Gemmatimonadaceae bacterium]|nr:NAD(P)H-quinone oxidoreductase [Gemmatimonadaceae bacterium]